jgi:uncharacterized membrane protein
MDAHLEMGSGNITYEDVKAAADENGRLVGETLAIVDRTVAKDRGEQAQEYEPVPEKRRSRGWICRSGFAAEGKVAMESKVKLFGHPIHPMVIVLPLGLLSAAVVFDIVYLVTSEDVFSSVAFWNIAAGVVSGLSAAVFGAWDWFNIPRDTRAKRIGLLHGAGNVVVVALFSLSWLLRLGPEGYEPGVLAYVLSFGGLGLAAVTSWLGGELVDRLGVGVDPGANLNAPNSLSGLPAAAEASRTGPAAGEP